MTKEEFYRGKTVRYVEWWLHSCDLPSLTWARLRVFSDGTADSCFGEGSKLSGFENRDYAGYKLSEDEYLSLDAFDAEDEQRYGIAKASMVPPSWKEVTAQEFEYLGTY